MQIFMKTILVLTSALSIENQNHADFYEVFRISA